MRAYTVHLRTPGERLDRDIVLVKEGFSWPAFFFSGLWALFSRLWLVAAVFIVAEVLLTVGAGLLGSTPLLELIGSLGLALIIGFIANDLKRWTLFRQGYAEIGVVVAPDRDAALQRFFDQHTRLAAGILR